MAFIVSTSNAFLFFLVLVLLLVIVVVRSLQESVLAPFCLPLAALKGGEETSWFGRCDERLKETGRVWQPLVPVAAASLFVPLSCL